MNRQKEINFTRLAVKKITPFCLGVFLCWATGCAITTTETVREESIPADLSMVSLAPIDRIQPGISMEEAKNVIGEGMIIGYQQNPDNPETFDPVKLDQPYRVETLKKGQTEYTIFYYYTQLRRADGLIAEDELTPLVFADAKVIGKGQSFLQQLKQP